MLIQSLDKLNTYIMEAGLRTPTENDSASLFISKFAYNFLLFKEYIIKKILV